MNLNEVGALLYWCEGSKREEDYRVEFVNSDPEMISIFMKYIRTKGVEERRLRIRMEIHVQDDEAECRRYWKYVTGLQDDNFIASAPRKPSNSKKHLPHGTVAIRYNSIALLREIKNEISSIAQGILAT